MIKNTPFTIYDAAAGSGKTFTLVKDYLKLILEAKSLDYYKYILAITFTNKAVAEMKERILENLIFFSGDTFEENPSTMAIAIKEDTPLTFSDIHIKSKKIVKHLLHHYSNFNVETIDSFNHRIIRTFARDLKLSGNFEVSLDLNSLQIEAVDQLISKAGQDSKITQLLLDFTFEKIDEDKSWDISRDILKTSSLMFNETDRIHFEKLNKKTLEDFIQFRDQLKKKIFSYTKEIIAIAKQTLQLIEEAGLEFSDFNRSYFPKHIQKLSIGDFKVNFTAQWHSNIGEVPLYTSGTLKNKPEIASVIDEIEPELVNFYRQSKEILIKVTLASNLLKNINPLSVINLVAKEFDNLKEEKNILPIAEFNQLIYKEIKNQPTPFIYERLGERYRHFFIDEFQDTSLLQWQNMIPLIENSISQQYADDSKGSLLLVGDAKQSIYRWRGGLPEQFMELCLEKTPFHTKPNVLHLPVNYRSCDQIIEFNNEFFTFSANYFIDKQHKNLYQIGNQQKTTNKEGGYVKIEFIESNNKEESQEIYANKTLLTIKELLKNGYQENDICILTRNAKDGISIGSVLLENNLNVISSETLLLQHSLEVQFLINCLKLIVFPENEANKILFLTFLYDHLTISDDKYLFFTSLIKASFEELSDYFKDQEIDFNFNTLQSLSLFESFEYCIRIFQLNKESNVYLFAFMDKVHEFEQQTNNSKFLFLEEWESLKEKEGVPVSNSIEGIQLMTIHKSKGLEFPIVIFPYADLNMYKEIDPKTWFPLSEEEYGFEESLINFNQEVKNYNAAGAEIYQSRRNTLELDNLNLMYVTLTRAESQLYVFSKTPTVNKEVKPTTYNQFFKEFLQHKGLWKEDTLVYEFGKQMLNKAPERLNTKTTIAPNYISVAPEEHSLTIASRDALLWGSEKEIAISSGNILHQLLEKIKQHSDVQIVLDELKNNPDFSSSEKEEIAVHINSLINHPELKSFFNSSDHIVNERKIITSQGDILIPDRLNFHNKNSVSVIDYKTGIPMEKHKVQIKKYANALKEMGYLVKEKILIYSSSEGIIVNKV